MMETQISIRLMETLCNGYEDIGGCTRRQPNAVTIEHERYAPVQQTTVHRL
jgi:hypothetical protein